MVVDDIDVNRLLLSEILKQKNVSIIEAINGKDAINKLRENDDINIILMDIKMLVMTGIDATRYIRRFVNSEIPIIAVTAYSYEFDDIKKFGFNDIIYKPFNSETIFYKIKKYIPEF